MLAKYNPIDIKRVNEYAALFHASTFAPSNGMIGIMLNAASRALMRRPY